MIPSPWVAVVLVLAVGRLSRLVGWDDLPPLARLRGWATGEYVVRGPHVQGTNYAYRRPTLAHFLGCAFCTGWWGSLAAYGLWVGVGSPGAVGYHAWPFYGLVPLALSNAVGLVAKSLDA